MALDGDTLKAAIKSSTLTQLQSLFPIDAGLTAGEQAALAAYQDKMAQAVAYGDGPDTVTHIVNNAEVQPGTMEATVSEIIAPSGGGPCTGNAILDSGTGTIL